MNKMDKLRQLKTEYENLDRTLYNSKRELHEYESLIGFNTQFHKFITIKTILKETPDLYYITSYGDIKNIGVTLDNLHFGNYNILYSMKDRDLRANTYDYYFKMYDPTDYKNNSLEENVKSFKNVLKSHRVYTSYGECLEIVNKNSKHFTKMRTKYDSFEDKHHYKKWRRSTVLSNFNKLVNIKGLTKDLKIISGYLGEEK